MNFGLKDFFMGVIHLFVIFLPGSLLLLTILVNFPGIKAVPKPDGISDVGLTLLFVGTSYFLGHLVSMFGSAIEDKVWQRPWRKKENHVDKDIGGDQKIVTIKRWWEGDRHGDRRLEKKAYDICRNELPVDLVQFGQFRRWAQHLVRHRDPGLRAEIDAKDADRRFFRNIRLVLIFPLAFAAQDGLSEGGSWVAFGVLAVITILTWLRYYDQDWKFTKLVFESVIVLDSAPKKKESN